MVRTSSWAVWSSAALAFFRFWRILLIKKRRFAGQLFWRTCWVACGLNSLAAPASPCRTRLLPGSFLLLLGFYFRPPFVFASPPSFPLLLLVSLARFDDGADKKGDDIDGTGSAQPRRRQEALGRTGELGARGPGKLAAQRKAEPANHLGFPARKSGRHPHKRQVRNRQPVRLAPQQREQPLGGDLLVGESKEDEPLLWSFAGFRHQQRRGGGMQHASLPEPAQGKQQR